MSFGERQALKTNLTQRIQDLDCFFTQSLFFAAVECCWASEPTFLKELLAAREETYRRIFSKKVVVEKNDHATQFIMDVIRDNYEAERKQISLLKRKLRSERFPSSEPGA